MSENHKEGAEAKPPKARKRASGTNGGGTGKSGGDIGRALRSVYDDTLRESVPDDFNDLLGKLL